MRNAFEGRSNGNGYGRGGWEEREPRSYRGRSFEDEREMYAMGDRSRGRDTIGHTNVVKVIEILAESERSWEDAAQMALREASKTIRNIRSIYVKDMQAVCRDGRIVSYRLNAKISFALETDRGEEMGSRDERYGRY